MSEYKIPLIPNLNLEKNEKEHYEFNVNVGKIKSKKTGDISEIYNINIEIYDKINISFEINHLDEKLLIRQSFNDSKIKFFDIECNSNEYNISLLNFYVKKNETNYGISSVKEFISGVCEECILVKNNNFINNNEKVRVWNILECSNTSHPKFSEFNSDNLSNVFLKSINTHDYYSKMESIQDLKKIHALEKKQEDSFNQLLGEDSFLYYEELYGKISNEIIDNIDILLMFYDSNIVPSRFVIFESKDTKKLEIKIKSKMNCKLNGKSIFRDYPNNLFNFLDSSYDKYICVKNNSNINIDLLFYYYVFIKNESYAEAQLIFCSAFFEVLKNNKFNPDKNENISFHEIFQKFNCVELDTSKLLKILQPEIFSIINDLEKKYITRDYNESDVKKICKKYKKQYLVYDIARYRNKIIHSGNVKFRENDVNEILENLIKKLKGGYKKDCQIELVRKIGDDIKEKLKHELNNRDSKLFIFDKTKLFEKIIEIYLLKVLDVDCLLSNEESKEYLDKFILKK